MSNLDYNKRGGGPYGRNRELSADVPAGAPYVPHNPRPFRVVNVASGAVVDEYATRARAEAAADALNRSSAATYEVRS
jgi:hypothetical protein